MNINNIKLEDKVFSDRKEIWVEIFKKQMALAEKYRDIEGMGDLLETTNDNVNTLKGQKWIKDFAWRVTEELAEAEEALTLIDEKSNNSVENEALTEHYKEELIDALHFLVELTIIAGHANYLPQAPDSIQEPWDVVYELGLMCNTLKNKPWKQTQMLTDIPKFTLYLNNAWKALYGILIQDIGDDQTIYNYYFKKNEVNKFRQRSKY